MNDLITSHDLFFFFGISHYFFKYLQSYCVHWNLLCVCVCAEGSGADAKVADSQGCWPRVLVSSRYPSLLFVPVVALNKTHKRDTKSHKPISLSVPDLTWLTAPETLSCVFMSFSSFFFSSAPLHFSCCVCVSVCVYVGLCVWKIRAPEPMQGPRCDSRAQHIIGLVDVQPSSSESFDRLVWGAVLPRWAAIVARCSLLRPLSHFAQVENSVWSTSSCHQACRKVAPCSTAR